MLEQAAEGARADRTAQAEAGQVRDRGVHRRAARRGRLSPSHHVAAQPPTRVRSANYLNTYSLMLRLNLTVFDNNGRKLFRARGTHVPLPDPQDLWSL